MAPALEYSWYSRASCERTASRHCSARMKIVAGHLWVHWIRLMLEPTLAHHRPRRKGGGGVALLERAVDKDVARVISGGSASVIRGATQHAY
eukprot:scaffold65333_cov30-Tisochrysis_lutea.AAC.1